MVNKDEYKVKISA